MRGESSRTAPASWTKENMVSTNKSALRELEDRLFEIYHRAGREVEYKTESGETRAYWPKRYLQALRRAVGEGDDELVEFVGRLVTSDEPSRGFGYLHDQERLDLTVEAIVADETAPYHDLFDEDVVRAARKRLAEHGYDPARVGEERHRRCIELTIEVAPDGTVTMRQEGRPPRSGTPLDVVRFFTDELSAIAREG